MLRGFAKSASALAAALFGVAYAPAFAADQSFDRGTRGVVEIETGAPEGVGGTVAANPGALLNDAGTRRIVPVLGDGSLQNIVDLKSLKGLDLAIVQADALDYARQLKLYPGLESVTYIARLYTEEFHLLARADIKSIGDLAGQKVDIGPEGGGTGITAQRLFTGLNIAVTPVHSPPGLALAKLAKGEIAAVALVSGKPAPLIRAQSGGDGLHLLSVPLKGPLAASYAPTRLTAKDYPGLVPADGSVDTVAVGMVLTAANLTVGSERYRNVLNFVDAFFTQFPTLLEPGHSPKWAEVNLAADLPGWRRYPAAEQWLARNSTPVAQKAQPADMRTVFQKFLDERLKASGTAMSQQQKDDLFGQFERWQSTQAR
jgi:uncharacterized protein